MVLIILLVLFQIFYEINAQIVAQTNYGCVQGVLDTSSCGKLYESFRGIPYAKPPMGDLRFKAPEPPEPWEGILDATQDGPFCIQKNYFFDQHPKVEGSEDCLYLNVYTPQLTVQRWFPFPQELLPVMVFIHWGGFFAGRGTSDYLAPDNFMDTNVILVTFNYRLGVLGFLTTLDDEAPGNYALKDQVAALQWVQDNIHYFGGDKNRVTLFGQSAGGGSVHYHLLSPLSRGLFHQAISQSGSALALWAKPLNIVQPNVTIAQATFVGCGEFIGNNTALIRCLRQVSAEELVASADKFKYFQIEPLTSYSAVVEQQTELNDRPFFTKEPIEYIQSGEFQNVPWIIGVVQDEGIIRAGPLTRQSDTLKQLNEQFSALFPQMLALSLSNYLNPTELYRNITDNYLGGQEKIDRDNPNSVQGLINLYTDRSFVYGSYQSAMLHASKNHSPIWFYNFDYKGQYTYGDLFASTDEIIPNFEFGISHCDDLLYLFSSPALFPQLTHSMDLTTRSIMIQMWTNFAIYGEPVFYNTDNFYWEKLNISSVDGKLKNEQLYILNITGSAEENSLNIRMSQGLYPERMRFWENQQLAENIEGLD